MANPRAACFLILHFITLFSVQSCMFDVFANAAILNISTDQSALLALKDHVSYDPHHVLTNNWSTSTSVCNWVGVTCGSKHLRVKALNLSYMGLVGTIPPHIGNLSFLVSLSISNNSFHGSLPTELSRLYRLESLNFRYNELGGEIPSWIGLLTKLQFLDLSRNKFGGTIPPSLSNITSLQEFSLAYNQLSGSIPSSIFNIFGLQKIILSGNKLTGPMPSILVNMSSLQYIYLTDNMLVGTLPMYLFDHLPNLQVISFSRNHFHGQLPSALYKCKQLQALSLSVNNFNGRISPEIGNLSRLTTLYLSHNNFEEYGLGGVVSTRGDVYSYGILLIETFTRKKPTDDMFAGEMSLKHWVKEALPISTMDIVDASLLGNERYFIALEECISSIMGLALDCCAELPEQRTKMKIILAMLEKIKTKYLRDDEGH